MAKRIPPDDNPRRHWHLRMLTRDIEDPSKPSPEALQNLKRMMFQQYGGAEHLPAQEGDADIPKNVFRREGDFWSITYEGQALPSLKHRDGFLYIAYLLQHPNEAVSVPTLRALKDKRESGPRHQSYEGKSQERWDKEGLSISGGNNSEEVVDQTAIETCQRRLEEIEAEKSTASGDTLDNLLDEEKKIKGYLNSGQGLGGRPRRVTGQNERGRSAVTKAVKAAIAQIKKTHDPLGAHLHCIDTGNTCMYRPEKSITWST